MAGYLGETIKSVRANLAKGDEYFVIDGGSTDGTLDVIRENATAVSYWVSEPDEGYADALAKGFARATGDILCWINAGDVLLAGALTEARSRLEGGEADLIFGDDFYIDEESRVIRFSRGFVSDLAAAMLYGGWTPLQDACFWTRELYLRVGGINPLLRYAADYDLFLRMARAGRTSHVPFAFSAFRRHQGQKSIASARAYADERELVRRRELAAVKESWMASRAKRFFYLNANRLRSRVAARRWRRADLEGQPINDLACAIYWATPGRAGVSNS